MTASYRIKQGVRALLAFREPSDLSLAAQYLSVPQLALFRQMPHLEQIHALDVLRSVLDQRLSFDDPRALDDLAAAALLHDCGKSLHRVRVWQKTLPVLVKAASPDLYAQLTERNPKHHIWRAFAVKAHHPAWGAEMAAHAGSSERVVWLIAHHQDDPAQWADHPHAELLRALQAADGVN